MCPLNEKISSFLETHMRAHRGCTWTYDESEQSFETGGLGALGSNHAFPIGPITRDDLFDVLVVSDRVLKLGRQVNPIVKTIFSGPQADRQERRTTATYSSISGTANLARVFSFHSCLHRDRTSRSCSGVKSVGVTCTPISLGLSPSLYTCQGMAVVKP